MKIINKNNFSIEEIPENHLSMYPNYVKLSDAQYSTIKSLEYQDGTDIDDLGNEVPNMVDLKLIESLQIVDNELISINFKDRDAEILKYQNEKINSGFFGFKYRVFVFDQKNFLEQNINFIKFDREVKSMERAGNAKVFENTVLIDAENKRFRIEQTVYIDFIAVAEIDYIRTLKCFEDDGITERNLVEVEENPTKFL